MSIERSSAASNPKAATGVEGQNNKSKVKSGAESDRAAWGGFSAILTSLEPPAAPTEAVDTELTADEKAKKAEAQPSDPIAAPTVNLPADLALLLEQAEKVADGKSSPVNDELPLTAKSSRRPIGATVGADKPELAIPASPRSTPISRWRPSKASRPC